MTNRVTASDLRSPGDLGLSQIHCPLRRPDSKILTVDSNLLLPGVNDRPRVSGSWISNTRYTLCKVPLQAVILYSGSLESIYVQPPGH